jgi:hypothetical protein
MRQPEIPQPAFPLRFENGQLVVVEQDSPDEVLDCVRVLIRTPIRTRLGDRDYGISDPTFKTGVDLDEIRAACDEYEPRAAAVIDTDFDIETLTREINVGVQTNG